MIYTHINIYFDLFFWLLSFNDAIWFLLRVLVIVCSHRLSTVGRLAELPSQLPQVAMDLEPPPLPQAWDQRIKGVLIDRQHILCFLSKRLEKKTFLPQVFFQLLFFLFKQKLQCFIFKLRWFKHRTYIFLVDHLVTNLQAPLLATWHRRTVLSVFPYQKSHFGDVLNR